VAKGYKFMFTYSLLLGVGISLNQQRVGKPDKKAFTSACCAYFSFVFFGQTNKKTTTTLLAENTNEKHTKTTLLFSFFCSIEDGWEGRGYI